MNQANNWQGVVEMIRRAGTRRGRERGGYFSIEGIRLHERALRAGVPVLQCTATAAFVEDSSVRVQTLLADLQQQGCRIHTVPDETMKEIIGDRDLGHILGLIKIPEQRRLDDIAGRRKPPIILVAVDVKDPGNVGAMIRTAHATGAAAFVAVGISDPYHPKALRTTMGSIFKLPVLHVEESLQLIGDLREIGIESVGTAVSGGVPLPQMEFSEAGAAIFLGSEAWGLPEEILTAVDRLVSIPMDVEVDSLSVNAAAAIVLYDIGRKWG